MLNTGDLIVVKEDLRFDGKILLKAGEVDEITSLFGHKVALKRLVINGSQYCVDIWMVTKYEVPTNIRLNNVIYVDFKKKCRI